MSYTKILEEYVYTNEVDNKFPDSDLKISKPLIILDGWYTEKKFEKNYKYALIKQNTFLYVLKFNIMNSILENKLADDISEENIAPYITFYVNDLTYPNLKYCKLNGEIVSNYNIDYSPGYIAFTINDSLILPILSRTTSNHIRKIRQICNEEYIKLQNKIKGLI